MGICLCSDFSIETISLWKTFLSVTATTWSASYGLGIVPSGLPALDY